MWMVSSQHGEVRGRKQGGGQIWGFSPKTSVRVPVRVQCREKESAQLIQHPGTWALLKRSCLSSAKSQKRQKQCSWGSCCPV